jgi:ABC-type polar amino acid transport system ATPase subunit
MAVRVIELQKTHPGAAAPSLSGLSLQVEAGKCAAILGKSGAGKSTLLRCLVGLDPFDSGAIEIDGARIEAKQRDSLAQLRGRIGFVFQSFELFPHLSVIENCTLAPVKVRGVALSDAEKRVRTLLGELGLADKADAYPEMLSGGQRQRVAIARALAMEPRVLLYDEPTSALDPSLRDEVRATVQRVGRTGMTQMIVTHDFAFAREVADVVFVLEKGRISRSGSPAEVLSPQDSQAA